MVYGAVKFLTFITIVGVMLALTVYYFDIRVDLEHMEITSNTRECVVVCNCNGTRS